MGGINSINNNVNVVTPVNSCEGTQEKKDNKTSLDFGQMIFDNIQREKRLQQKKEAEEEKQEKEEKPNPVNIIHQQYMMMEQLIPLKKKEEEKKK